MIMHVIQALDKLIQSIDKIGIRTFQALGTGLKIPPASTQVYKKECTFGFDTPDCDEGIFLNLTSFQSFGKEFLQLDQQKTGFATPFV